MKPIAKFYFLALITSLSFLHTAHGMNLFGDKKPSAVLAGQSKIIVTTQLRLLEVDGEKHSLNLLNSGDTIVDVTPGYHEFTVRYDKIWDIDYDNFDKLKSASVTVSIATEGGKSYRITHHELESYKDAKAFSNNPEIFVVDAVSGANVAAAKKEEFIPADKTAPAYKPATVAVPTATASATAKTDTKKGTFRPESKADTTKKTDMESARPAVLPMLQYWWGQASVEEKQRFYDWIQETHAR